MFTTPPIPTIIRTWVWSLKRSATDDKLELDLGCKKTEGEDFLSARQGASDFQRIS